MMSEPKKSLSDPTLRVVASSSSLIEREPFRESKGRSICFASLATVVSAIDAYPGTLAPRLSFFLAINSHIA
jgi:hypothetical protein